MGKIKPYRFESGDILTTSKTTWTVLGRKITSEENKDFTGRKAYLCKCHKCNSSLWKMESELFMGVKGKPGMGNCGVCGNRIIVTGKNDVATTHPECVRFFRDPEEALHINAGSREKFWFKCCDCGYEFQTAVEYVTKDKQLKCPKCRDNISYPNKFAMSVLSQLKAKDLVPEYSPSWAGNYRYDFSFYCEGIHYLLEMDGGFHYEKRKFEKYNQTRKSDKEKNILAQKNNCTLIRIECCKSELEYIKKNFVNSELNKIFNLSLVDWQQVETDCKTNLLVEIAKYYNDNPDISLDIIANKFHVCKHTARNYLKRSQKIGLTNYKTLLDEMDENFSKVIDIRKKHPDYTYHDISSYVNVSHGTVRNYLIKAESLGLIDFADAKEYRKHITREYIKTHPNATNVDISNYLGCCTDYVAKRRKELAS